MTLSTLTSPLIDTSSSLLLTHPKSGVLVTNQTVAGWGRSIRGAQVLSSESAISSVLDMSIRSLPGDHGLPLQQALPDVPQGMVDALKIPKSPPMNDELRVSTGSRTLEPVASEGVIRGRSYNIRLDDQVLLRFSPTKPESTYYFGDMIGGTLTLFHEEETRRCLELLVSLELSETISRRSAHPSRKYSPTITKENAGALREPKDKLEK
ncbi:unnamed protein product [Lactuca saligna]|uniref:Uncharacterized protein n=1 Tax=Lactuca saligna TaxID=75948 RepID=A0AA35ZVD3_LACSI|nr:unnamed protein product [Lactuca saligna]